MPVTNAVSGFSTFLQRGDGGGPETFTTIAEVVDIKPGEFSLETPEVTNMGSVGGFEEVIATIIRTGACTFDVNWMPSNSTQSSSAGLVYDMVNRVKRNFKVIFPDGLTTWQFSGYVNKFTPEAPHDKKLKASFSIKITGKPTI